MQNVVSIHSSPLRILAAKSNVDPWIIEAAHEAYQDPYKAYAGYFVAVRSHAPGQVQNAFPFYDVDYSTFHLYCTLNGTRYRVTGACKDGTLKLSSDLKAEHSHNQKAHARECSDWSCLPSISAVPDIPPLCTMQ